MSPRVTLGALCVLLSTAFEVRAQQAFYSVTPCRAVDTRNPGYGGPVYASTERDFTIKGVCNVPTDAKSVALNLTIVTPTVDGFETIWPKGGTYPVTTSNINFTAGTPSLANGVIVGLYLGGTPDLATAYGSSTGAGMLHLVLDVTGYYK